jgi:hypothetical protein
MSIYGLLMKLQQMSNDIKRVYLGSKLPMASRNKTNSDHIIELTRKGLNAILYRIIHGFNSYSILKRRGSPLVPP